MAANYKGVNVPHRTVRSLAVEKGTDPANFTNAQPAEGAIGGGSMPAAVSGGTYKATPGHLPNAAPLHRPTENPFKNLRGS
jgi:hypothetical protein